MHIVRYKPAARGIGTESSERLQPLEYSPNIVNRFYNLLGDLEKRRGSIAALSKTVSFGGSGNGTVRSTYGLYEYINTSGQSTIFAHATYTNYVGATSNGMLTYDTSVSAWISRTPSFYVFGDDTSEIGQTTDPVYAAQMGNKIIFTDGIHRTSYFDSSSPSGRLLQLHAVVENGVTGTGTSANRLFDNNIRDWVNETNVAVNDMIGFQPAGTGTVGPLFLSLITSVGTTSLDMLTVGTAATGLGYYDISTSSLVGVPYRIFDMVELNIVRQGDFILDNSATTDVGTSALGVKVTAQNFSGTEARIKDIIYNTTRGSISYITTVQASVSGMISMSPAISTQVAGDSVVFLKEAMPIASFPHVHYGRLHLIDARDATKIRVSGPDDPEDFTTFNKTLQSITIDYSAKQPKGDVLLTLDTFQRYLVAGGKQAVYATEATNPIQDVTADVVDLDPVGLFPQGVVSPQGLQSIGSEMFYIANDGLRTFTASFDAKNTLTRNASEQIKTELIHKIEQNVSAQNQLQLIHYPRRNWVMLKVGSTIYNYNYTPTYQGGQFVNTGTFTKFTGLPATQSAYLVRRDGSMLTADTSGNFYIFDVSGVHSDNGATIPTTYTSPWHTLQEGQSNIDIYNLDGRYIKPVFETSAQINYTISVVGGYNNLSQDSVVVTSNTSGITNPKAPLRWRGEQCQITITTDTSSGTDILSSYTIYGNIFGWR